MASVIKKCDDPQHKWRTCKHPWVVRYRDDAGRQREKTFLHDQKTLANDLKTRAEHARKAGEGVYPDKPVCPYTFGEYAERVIRQSPVSERTEATYLGILRNHLASLASRNLADVASDRIGVTNLLLVTLPGSGLGRKTSALAQVVIGSTMNAAVNNGDLDSHRLARIRLPRPSDEEAVDPATIEKLDRNMVAVLAGALPPRLALAAWLSYGCGLRVSEALAVRLTDFSDDLTKLTIARQVLSGSRVIPLKARDPGKTRSVPVPGWTAQRVHEHVEAFGVGPDSCLFPGQRSRYTPRASLTRPWQKARRLAGLPELRYHDLRHAWCSRLISEGVTSAEVAKMAGHRNSTVTETVYFHFLPKAFDRARDVLNAWT